MSRSIVVIAHDLRSTHNVGSLLRTAEGLGVEHVYMTGYTPYPRHGADKRLPHEAAKIHRAIEKTALGAENSQPWTQETNLDALLKRLRSEGYIIAALEQAQESIRLPDWQPPQKVVIILGREVEGIDAALLKEADVTLEIPMSGRKESFNVVQAAAMALYHLRFTK